MKECCNNCAFQYTLVKFDYSKGGCIHTKLDGYLCALFMNQKLDPERNAIWMIGTDGDGMCECYTPKEKQDKLKHIVPDCPYCKRKLGEIRDGKRWCYNCHFWINADGSKAQEEREWLK